MPQEVEVRYILPTIRKEFAVEFETRGISRGEVAKILGITPAAVTMYLNKKRASYVNLTGKGINDIKNSVTRILEKTSSPYEEIYRISKILTIDRTVCQIHRSFDKNVPKDCKICMQSK